MQNGIHEVARAIAGEGPPSAIGAVRAGCEAEDEYPRARIAKAGDGARPVVLIAVGCAPGLANAGTVLAQPRTKLAGDDRVANPILIGCGCKRGLLAGQDDAQRWGRNSRPDRFH